MSYTTTAEVQTEFKSTTFTGTSNPSTTAVDGFVTEADALINSYVGTVYVVPVTTGDALNLLKLLSRSLVVARIKKMMEVKQASATDANQNVVSVLLSTTQVMKILTDIQTRALALAGAVKLNSGGGFYSNNVATGVCAKVHKDRRQW